MNIYQVFKNIIKLIQKYHVIVKKLKYHNKNLSKCILLINENIFLYKYILLNIII